MDDPSPSQAGTSGDFGLSTFQKSGDQGLSLDQLSAAFAEMLDRGHDPYAAPGERSLQGGLQPPVDAPLDASVIDPVRAADEPDDKSCEVTPRSILEAMLFVGSPTNEPLTSQRVAGLMRGVRAAEIDDLVRDLNADYAANRCPYAIESVGAGYRLSLAPEFERIREKCYGRARQLRLSAYAIEVLAVVAYNEPIGAEAIDEARGKPSAAVLRQLVRRQLLRIESNEQDAKQPLYRTAQRFLDLFGLDSLDDLPKSLEIDQR